MSLSEKIRATVASIAEARTSMKEDTLEAKKRFFAFVDEHNIPLGYAEYPWVPGIPANISEDVDLYYLEVGYYNPKGIIFSHDTYDGSETVLIPFEYLDDPEAWEAKVLEDIASDRNLVEETLKSLPEGDSFVVEGIRLDGHEDDAKSISVELNSSAYRSDRPYSVSHFMSISRAAKSITYISSELRDGLEKKGFTIP